MAGDIDPEAAVVVVVVAAAEGGQEVVADINRAEGIRVVTNNKAAINREVVAEGVVEEADRINQSSNNHGLNTPNSNTQPLPNVEPKPAQSSTPMILKKLCSKKSWTKWRIWGMNHSMYYVYQCMDSYIHSGTSEYFVSG